MVDLCACSCSVFAELICQAATAPCYSSSRVRADKLNANKLCSTHPKATIVHARALREELLLHYEPLQHASHAAPACRNGSSKLPPAFELDYKLVGLGLDELVHCVETWKHDERRKITRTIPCPLHTKLLDALQVVQRKQLEPCFVHDETSTFHAVIVVLQGAVCVFRARVSTRSEPTAISGSQQHSCESISCDTTLLSKPP